LVEAHTRRLGGHYSGDAQHYRPSGQLDEWRADDPLTRLADEISRPADLAELRARVDREVDDALSAARNLPYPDPATATSAVYAAR
jgi:TPP-dependent pyruvate/acetoin dehydrogenase alpha subunit